MLSVKKIERFLMINKRDLMIQHTLGFRIECKMLNNPFLNLLGKKNMLNTLERDVLKLSTLMKPIEVPIRKFLNETS